jgi:hypothetical protein
MGGASLFQIPSISAPFADPMFEFGGVLLADDDLLIGQGAEIYAYLAFRNHPEFFDIIHVDDKIPVRPEKGLIVEQLFNVAQAMAIEQPFIMVNIVNRDGPVVCF